MSLSKVFAPGTLFRARLSDDSKHYTAILLKNGKVLEVKNPDTGVKSTFDSVELWQASHPDCMLEFDASKSSGYIISSDTFGFNYPTEKDSAYIWLRWLYSMIGEAAPQLLLSEELKTLYNQMVELSTKHSQELNHWAHCYTGKYRYDSKNLKATNYGNKDRWDGYPGYFPNENYYSRYFDKGHKCYSTDEYNTARAEIVSVYKKIYEIVEPTVSKYMTKKHNFLATQAKIAQTKATIKKYEKKTYQLENSIKWYKERVQTETANLATYQTELITMQTEAL